MSENETLSRWNSLHAIPRFSPRYPSELVIRWTFRNFPRDRSSKFKLLDVGAGAGRHAIFWAKEGYRASATDISAIAIAQIIDWSQQEQLVVNTQTAEADALPYENETFDGLLSFGVLYYLPYPRIKSAVAEMLRVLKPGGRAYVMVKSDSDSRSLGAKRVDQWAYQVEPVQPGASWASEVGLVLTLLDIDELRVCFSEFSAVEIDYSKITSCNGQFLDAEWLLQLRK